MTILSLTCGSNCPVGHSALCGCVPVDTAVYDIAAQLESVEAARRAIYRGAFGDSASQKELSPITHVTQGRHLPPFLILHVAERPDATRQSQQFAQALQEAGVSAKVVAAAGKTHGTINSELGLPNDPPTQAVWEFLGVGPTDTSRQ